MGSSRKAKARRKTTHTKVKASVVARCRVPHAAAATPAPRAVRADRRATLRRLACARSATACRCRSCCRGRRRGEPPPPLRSLRCAPLLTRAPGARARSTPWDKETTLRRNYKALGLACDPNGEHGRLNSVKRVAAAQQEAEEAEEVSALRLGAAPSLLALTPRASGGADAGRAGADGRRGAARCARAAPAAGAPAAQTAHCHADGASLAHLAVLAVAHELTRRLAARGGHAGGGARGRHCGDGARHQAQQHAAHRRGARLRVCARHSAHPDAHPAQTLRVLVAAFHAHRSGDRHEFRAPKKRL